jgi:hypothetical protein
LDLLKSLEIVAPHESFYVTSTVLSTAASTVGAHSTTTTSGILAGVISVV